MKFYYEATHHIPYEEDGYSFLCVSNNELQKNDYVIVHLHDDIGFALAVITKRISEVDALTQRVKLIPIIQHADKVKQFESKLNDEIKMNSLLLDLEEKAKRVKTIETYRKLAAQNSEFKEMFSVYEKLLNSTNSTTEDTSEFI